MVPSNNRITQNEFKTFFTTGKHLPHPFFTLVWGSIPSEKLITKPKCAVVTPRGVSKKAVERNKIRRRVYSILNKNKKDLQNKTFYIFLTKKAIKTAKFKNIVDAIETMLLKTKKQEKCLK